MKKRYILRILSIGSGLLIASGAITAWARSYEEVKQEILRENEAEREYQVLRREQGVEAMARDRFEQEKSASKRAELFNHLRKVGPQKYLGVSKRMVYKVEKIMEKPGTQKVCFVEVELKGNNVKVQSSVYGLIVDSIDAEVVDHIKADAATFQVVDTGFSFSKTYTATFDINTFQPVNAIAYRGTTQFDPFETYYDICENLQLQK